MTRNHTRRAARATMLAAVAGAILLPRHAVAQGSAGVATLPFDPAVTVGTLPNGMRYYIQAHPQPAHRADLRLVVDAGSVMEEPQQLGLAHFVEHMAFNGSRRFAKLQIQHELESMGMQFGADLNAETTADETAYFLTVPTDHPGALTTGMKILADWASGVAFDSAAVEAERGIVMGEWRLRTNAGAGDFKRFGRYTGAIIPGSAYGDRSPIGDPRIIQHASRAEIKRFYTRWYRPQRMAVVVVGDVDASEVERLVKQEMGAIPAGPRTPETDRAFPSRAVPVPHTSSFVVDVDPTANGRSINLAYRVPERPSGTGDRRAALAEEIAVDIVNERMGAMRVGGAYVGEAARHARAWFLVDNSQEDIRGELAKLFAVPRQVVEHGFTDAEVERVRKNLLTNREHRFVARAAATSSQLADSYQDAFLTGAIVPPADTSLALARALLAGPGAITTAEVDSIARLAFDQPGVVGFISLPANGQQVDAEFIAAVADSVGKSHTTTYDAKAYALADTTAGKKGYSIDDSAAAIAARPLIPSLPPAGRIDSVRQIPSVGVTVWTLSNGAHVLLKPTTFNPDQFLVLASAPGGTSTAKPAEYVDARLAGQALALGGLGTFTPEALQKKLSTEGSSVSIAGGIQQLNQYVTGSASPKDAKVLFELLHLEFTAPRLDTAAISRWKEGSRASLDDPGQLFQQEVQARLAHFDPRQRPLTAAMMDSLDPQAALAFYKERFSDASAFTFIVVGAFDPDSLRPLVEKYVASLPATHANVGWHDDGARAAAGPEKIDLYNGFPGRTQVSITYTIPIHYDESTDVRNYAVGQIAQRRLLARLRTQLSATYGVQFGISQVKAPWQHAAVSVGFDSDPALADSLARAAVAVLDTLGRSGPTAAEVAELIANEKQRIALAVKDNSYWVQKLSSNLADGFDLATGLVAPDPRVDRLTIDVLRQTAAELFGPSSKAVQLFVRPPSGD